MSYVIHTLVWDNIASDVVRWHKQLTQHFQLPVVYTHENTPHGAWMDRTLHAASEDVVGFFDIDCVPTNTAIVDYAVTYANTYRTFLGTAQATNHIGHEPRCHIFAAPAFFFIQRAAWHEIGAPSFAEAENCDVAQYVSKTAERAGRRYKCLYPTHWENQSTDGAWRLGNYGLYGIGTHYRGGVYHLYQSRYNYNVELFAKRCEEIIAGTFTVDDMHSTFEDYTGHVCW
jgi:hypothetical protein